MKGTFILITSTSIFLVTAVALLLTVPKEQVSGSSLPKVSKERELHAKNTNIVYDGWRFLVIADVHGMTPFSWDNLTKNKNKNSYIEQESVINYINETFGGELIMTPGDVPSYGRLSIEDIVDKLGGHISDQEAIYEAGRNCFNNTRELFKSAGYDTLIAAVGDHEIGGNEGFRVSGPHSKVATLTDARRAVGDGFNRNNENEFIFNQSLFGMPSRPLGTPFENTTFAYLHKNVLFITVDAFEIVGDGSENYIDRENGFGGEGAVTCTVSGDHLAWLENILYWGKTNTNVRHIIVQAHLPIIQPVRRVKCSGQFLDAGEQSDFWSLMETFDVDIYFAGEVHTNTATKTKQPGSNLIQIVSRGNKFNNFLTVDVTADVIDVKVYNEFGDNPKWNAQYKEAGHITIDKTDILPKISSSGMLKLLELNSSIISFDFEEIKPMGTRQIPAMLSEDNLVAKSITIRDTLCTESFLNIGAFGAQYDAQVANITLVDGRYGRYAASFNTESRMAIFGTGPFSAGEVFSFGFWFKTSELSRKMILLHHANYWGKTISGVEKDYLSLILDNGTPVLYTNHLTSLMSVGLQNLADGQWHHIAVSMPQKSCLVSELDIFVDGETVNTVPTKDHHIFHTTSGRLSVGGYGYSNSGFEDEYPDIEPYIGIIDDFLLFARSIDIDADFTPMGSIQCFDSPLQFKQTNNGYTQKIVCISSKVNCAIMGTSSHCKEICGKTGVKCGLDSSADFKVKDDDEKSLGYQDCEWVSEDIIMRCSYPGVYETCPYTCGASFSVPLSSAPTIIPVTHVPAPSPTDSRNQMGSKQVFDSSLQFIQSYDGDTVRIDCTSSKVNCDIAKTSSHCKETCGESGDERAKDSSADFMVTDDDGKSLGYQDCEWVGEDLILRCSYSGIYETCAGTCVYPSASSSVPSFYSPTIIPVLECYIYNLIVWIYIVYNFYTVFR